MNIVAVVFANIIISAHSGVVPVGRNSEPSPTTPGWTTTPPTTEGWTTTPSITQGWTTPPTIEGLEGWTTTPSTTQGWTTTPPDTTQGWTTLPPSTTSASINAGWNGENLSNEISTIDLDAVISASGTGWASGGHSDNVNVVGGDGGWSDPSAEIAISTSGQSVLDQQGDVLQETSQDNETVLAANNAAISQIVASFEGGLLGALGLEINSTQNEWAGGDGEGAVSSVATTTLSIQQLTENFGILLARMLSPPECSEY